MEYQNKSNLAKLLAAENISFQHDPSASTAYFDIKSRLLVLPVWENISNDLYDMLVVHEVGHALDTPAEGWLGAIEDISQKAFPNASENLLKTVKKAVKGFLNVIEDARIDKRQKRRYPGARRNYVIGYKELIDRDFFGTASKDIHSMSFIDRANIFFKGGYLQGIKFNDEDERRFIRLMENTETFEEVISLTEEIFLWSKQKAEEQSLNMEDILSSVSEEGEGDRDEFEYGDDEDGEYGDVISNSMTSDNTGNSDHPIERFIPVSDTERAWNQSQEKIVVNSNTKYVYLDIPKPHIDNIVHDYKKVMSDMKKCFNELRSNTNLYYTLGDERYTFLMESLNKFKRDEMETISFMLKEFEMRKHADIYSRTSIAKTGVIDTNKLPSYKFSEDLFRRVSVVSEGKNHGFVMFLDWSGSMSNNLNNTLKQLFSLTMFCKRLQIPFEVYTFKDYSDSRKSDSRRENECFTQNDGELILDKLNLRNILSSRMKIIELNEMYQYLWINSHGHLFKCDTMGGTPLNSAIIAAEEVINQFRKKTKVQIVNAVFLTDGESNGVHRAVGRKFTGFGYYDVKTQNQNIIRDNVSKKEYMVNNNIGVTNSFLKILKDRTDVNLVGFFLHDGGFKYLTDRYSKELNSEASDSWNKNNFIAVNSDGYDEYYIINTRKMNLVKEELKVDSNMSKRKIATAFSTFSKKKAVNRILLRRFVEKITKVNKKVG